MKCPKGYFNIGPLVVMVDIIEQTTMYNVRVGITPTEMHPVTFETDDQLLEFVYMLEWYSEGKAPDKEIALRDIRYMIKEERRFDKRCGSSLIRNL